MEQLVLYLETIGYTIEEQGKVQKYLIVFYDGLPVGFILPDFSIRLVTDADGAHQKALPQILAFFGEHKDLPTVGNGEFLLVNYRGSQLTAFYHTKHKKIQFASYVILNETGEVQKTLYTDYQVAIKNFVQQSHMIELQELKSVPQKSLGKYIRKRLLQYLLNKSQEE